MDTNNFAAKWGDALEQSDWPSNVLFALDCADVDAVGDIAPEDIYPNAPFDEPYDDIDQNCAGDNDFDADGDGFAPAEYSAEYAGSYRSIPMSPQQTVTMRARMFARLRRASVQRRPLPMQSL